MAEILERFLRRQAKAWPKVTVRCTEGNHGRSSKFAHENENADRLCYQHLASGLKGSGVDIRVPKQVFFETIEACGGRIVLSHGHFIRTMGGTPVTASQTYFLKLHSSGRLKGGFQITLQGHLHHDWSYPVNGFRMLAQGTMIPATEDDHAFLNYGKDSTNTWWSFLFDGTQNPPWMSPINSSTKLL